MKNTVMQAIVTKSLGPTNNKGARIKATCNARSLTMPYNHELDPPDNHLSVANELLCILGWDKDCIMVQGALPKNAGYVFVLVLKPINQKR